MPIHLAHGQTSIVSPGCLLCKYLLHPSHKRGIRNSVFSLRTSFSSSSTRVRRCVKKVTLFSLSRSFSLVVSHALTSSVSFMMLLIKPYPFPLAFIQPTQICISMTFIVLQKHIVKSDLLAFLGGCWIMFLRDQLL